MWIADPSLHSWNITVLVPGRNRRGRLPFRRRSASGSCHRSDPLHTRCSDAGAPSSCSGRQIARVSEREPLIRGWVIDLRWGDRSRGDLRYQQDERRNQQRRDATRRPSRSPPRDQAPYRFTRCVNPQPCGSALPISSANVRDARDHQLRPGGRVLRRDARRRDDATTARSSISRPRSRAGAACWRSGSAPGCSRSHSRRAGSTSTVSTCQRDAREAPAEGVVRRARARCGGRCASVAVPGRHVRRRVSAPCVPSDPDLGAGCFRALPRRGRGRDPGRRRSSVRGVRRAVAFDVAGPRARSGPAGARHLRDGEQALDDAFAASGATPEGTTLFSYPETQTMDDILDQMKRRSPSFTWTAPMRRWTPRSRSRVRGRWSGMGGSMSLSRSASRFAGTGTR